MNISLWILQGLLAFHTLMGAGWKLSHSAAQTAPSLKAIPQGVWLGLMGIELLCAIAFILPAASKRLAFVTPIAAVAIAAEMLLFSGVHLTSGIGKGGELVYWLIVAALCAFVAYGRFALKPIGA